MKNQLSRFFLKKILLLIIAFTTGASANSIKFNFKGVWNCEQHESISSSLIGENNYILEFNQGLNRVVQKGLVRIVNEDTQLKSAIAYECSGQLILATVLESWYLTSDSFGAKPAL